MKYFFTLMFLFSSLFACDGLVDPAFYDYWIIEHEGHLYKILLIQHHELCPCDY